MASPKLHNNLRKYHRWIGFFLAGIMAVYSISGVLLIFRKTDFLKYEYTVEKSLTPGLEGEALRDLVNVKNFEIVSETQDSVIFTQGSYSKQTGQVVTTKKDYPIVLAKLVNLHKATTNSPLFYLNIVFGVCLLFFVISAFLMFLPKTLIYKNSLKIAAGGFIFAIVMVVFGS